MGAVRDTGAWLSRRLGVILNSGRIQGLFHNITAFTKKLWNSDKDLIDEERELDPGGRFLFRLPIRLFWLS